MMSDERKLKHLEFIQGVINRLSTNSFLLKGWSVVLVSALFALSAADSQPIFALLACIPAFVFWGLDGPETDPRQIDLEEAIAAAGCRALILAAIRECASQAPASR